MERAVQMKSRKWSRGTVIWGLLYSDFQLNEMKDPLKDFEQRSGMIQLVIKVTVSHIKFSNAHMLQFLYNEQCG